MPIDTPRPADAVRRGLANARQLREGMAQAAADLAADRDQAATQTQTQATADQGAK